MILLQRGGCERRCAVYRVVLFGDGTGIFDGEYYVNRPGVVRLRVPVQRISAFIEQAIGRGFFNMRAEYGISDSTGCSSFDNDDAPIAVITISAAGHAKTVVHHHRCIGDDTNRLTVLEDDVDKIVNAASLIRGGERTK